MWFRLTAPDGNTVALLGSAIMAIAKSYRKQSPLLSLRPHYRQPTARNGHDLLQPFVRLSSKSSHRLGFRGCARSGKGPSGGDEPSSSAAVSICVAACMSRSLLACAKAASGSG
jgi:hypothetical protein